jgi:hypothetical protein
MIMILDKGNWVLHVTDPPPISSSEITKSLEHQQNGYVAFPEPATNFFSCLANKAQLCQLNASMK